MTAHGSTAGTGHRVTEQWVEEVALGGAVLGGGGGGDPDEGIEFGRLAVEYGELTVGALSDLAADELVVTVSAVGAPAAPDRHVDPADYVAALERLRDRLSGDGERIGAIMTNEMGGFASVNGLLQSVVTGIPLVDAACNGRAHPTGPMGSMGLPRDETFVQSAVGGDGGRGRHVALTVEATLPRAADTVRSAAETAGGLVGVARNPVDAAYVADHGAVGVYGQARRLGGIVRGDEAGRSIADRLAEELGGSVPITGPVEAVDLETRGGFDVGTAAIDGRKLTFWNEYMTLDDGDERVATFPDLISTIDLDTGRPLTTAALTAGDEVAVLVAPKASLTLGAGMRSPALFEPVEEATGEAIIEYAFPEGAA